MKKFKKIFAVLLTLAMVLGMSMTTFAATNATYESDITVAGLSAQEEETVNLYAAITLNDDKNAWVVAEWAQPYIQLNEVSQKYEIMDAEGLSKAVPSGAAPYEQAHAAGITEVTFEDVPVGAYVITASGEKIVYLPMVAETYVENETYMQAENVKIIAKSSGYDVDKTADDHFVARGETVNFTVTTTFPSFSAADSNDNSFKIIDTPTGLDITEVTSVTVGGTEVTEQCTTNKAANGEYTINLSALIGTVNANAGKVVVVEYKAVVTADDGYENTANAYRNEDKSGGDSEEGFTGDITLTKYAEDETTVLEGAEFKLYKGTKEEKGEALYFVKTADGEYKLALSETENNATQILAATSGTLKVTGLDEGDYWFEETKAPEGYSINEDGAAATVTENTENPANVSVTASLIDTKLMSLPGTGGIGTTIFTFAGCLTMMIAAGLLFVSRKKAK